MKNIPNQERNKFPFTQSKSINACFSILTDTDTKDLIRPLYIVEFPKMLDVC